jgi:RNA polymerase sigma factor (sigma-70 family)
VEVIADEDAVYGIVDPHARAAGTTLDLTGTSGAQTLRPGPNEDFEVAVDCSSAEETQVRIRLGKHVEFTLTLETTSTRVVPLAPSRERALVLAAAAGDAAACAQVVESFLPAIAGVARLYRGVATVQRAELLQEGVVGLLRAIKRFDPALGTPFWAYATWWVRQAMQQLISEVTRPTVLSDRAQRGLARVREARRVHTQAHGREPTTAELATATGLPREQVESLLATERAPRALEAPLREGEGGETLEDLLADPLAEEEYEQIISRIEIDQVHDLAETLDGRARAILYDHYGLGGPAKTLREIGDGLGISAERVRQIEEQALDELRAAVAFGT